MAERFIRARGNAGVAPAPAHADGADVLQSLACANAAPTKDAGVFVEREERVGYIDLGTWQSGAQLAITYSRARHRSGKSGTQRPALSVAGRDHRGREFENATPKADALDRCSS